MLVPSDKQRSPRLEFRRGPGAGQMDVNATYRELLYICFRSSRRFWDTRLKNSRMRPEPKVIQ